MSSFVLQGVSYRYEGGMYDVLNDINATFESGKVNVIIGQSGAGKSTLLALISGLDICTEGTIFHNCQNLRDIDRDDYRAKGIGVIFQGYNLLMNLTAVENIVLSMNISNSDQKSRTEKFEFAYDLLHKVGIDKETADRKILKLSGGEQQRVGIARALSHHPDVIVADEPTANLDDETENSILNIFTSLAHNDGKCVIIVTHSERITSIADEVWGIEEGNMHVIK
jgi:putative ABC transport system ATP-binding protein